MRVLKSIILIVGALILTAPLSAQKENRMRRGQDIRHISQELDLSDKQQAQVKEIMMSSRKSRRDNQDASRAAVESKIIEILNIEQLTAFKELKVEREEKKAKRKGALVAVQNFKQNNVKPYIHQKRMELESQLSTEDKTILNRIRAERPKRIEDDRQERKGKKNKSHRLSKENREALKVINEKYAADINRMQEDIEANQEAWNKEIKSIREAYVGEEDGREKGEGRQSERSPRKDKRQKRGEKEHMKNVRFLLMEVDNL